MPLPLPAPLSIDEQRPNRSTVHGRRIQPSRVFYCIRGGSHLGPERDLHTLTTDRRIGHSGVDQGSSSWCKTRVGRGSGPSTGRVGSRFFPYLVGCVGSRPFVWAVGLQCWSPWIIQNAMLSVIVKFTQFSELLVLLKLFSV